MADDAGLINEVLAELHAHVEKGVGRVLRGIGIFAPSITDDKEDGCARSAHDEK